MNSKNEVNLSLIEKINELEKQHGINLSNTKKILFTTDGSVTAILEVLYGKITLKTLDQHFEDDVIINNDEILMWIKEMLPVSYFTEKI